METVEYGDKKSESRKPGGGSHVPYAPSLSGKPTPKPKAKSLAKSKGKGKAPSKGKRLNVVVEEDGEEEYGEDEAHEAQLEAEEYGHEEEAPGEEYGEEEEFATLLSREGFRRERWV